MSSIAEQQNLLWKVYQQHRSILNNCSIELNKPSTSVINDTHQHQQYLNHSISVVDDDDIIVAPSTTVITTTDTITSSFNNSIDNIGNSANSNNINPCDSKLMSDIGSMIVQLERLITHTNAGENIVGDDSSHQHQHVGASDMDSVENSNYGNQTFNYGVAIGAIGIGGGGSQQQPIRTDQFYIKYPHDMLHPSMNPCVIGNSVVIATWSMHGKFRSPTAVFLVSLAIADLLLLLVFVPLETLEYFMITWTGMSSICKMIAYVEAISAMATVMNLVAVSTERFLVIVYPMRARSWCTMSSTRKGLIIIWSFAFVLSTPVLLTRHTSQITYYNSTTSLTLYYCFDVENDLTFIVAIYQLLVMFILPALFMVVCYYVVIRQLWISTRSVNLMTQAENQARQAFVSRKSNYSLMHRKNITNMNSSSIRNFDNEKSFYTDYTQVMSSFNNNNNGNVEEINLKRLNESTETTTALTVRNHYTDDNTSILSSRNNQQEQHQHQQYDNNKVITTEIGNNSIETLTDLSNELNNNSIHYQSKPSPASLSLQQLSSSSTKVNKNYKINKNSIIIIDTTKDKWNDNNIEDNLNPLIEINVDNVDDEEGEDDDEVIEIRVEPHQKEDNNYNNEDANSIVVEVASTTYQMSNFIIDDYDIQNNNKNELNPLNDDDANIDCDDTNNYNHDRIVEFHQQQLQCKCNANQQQKREEEIQRRTKIESESELNDPDDEKHHLQPKPPPSTNTTVQARSRNLSSNVMEITKSRIQVIKMLVLIIVLFLLCWGPRLIMNVLVKSGLSTYSSWIYNTRVMCNLLSFIHSALNPFVYGFMSSNFRSMVCSSFGSRRRRRNRNNNNTNDNLKPSKQLSKRIFSENRSENNSIAANINTLTNNRRQEIK